MYTTKEILSRNKMCDTTDSHTLPYQQAPKGPVSEFGMYERVLGRSKTNVFSSHLEQDACSLSKII